MREHSYVIGKNCEWHARPAAALLKIAKTHGCELFIKTGEDWKRAGIMNLLLLKTTPGAQLTLGAQGGAADACLIAIRVLLEGA